jgi:hypothetical protein
MAATVPDIFGEFSRQIEQILATLDDPGLVVHALEELGEGHHTNVSGVKIGPLPCLVRVSQIPRAAIKRLC